MTTIHERLDAIRLEIATTRAQDVVRGRAATNLQQALDDALGELAPLGHAPLDPIDREHHTLAIQAVRQARKALAELLATDDDECDSIRAARQALLEAEAAPEDVSR